MYISTRGNQQGVTASTAIYLGMVPQGGLFVPDEVPRITPEDCRRWENLDYPALANEILKLFLDDYTAEEITECTGQAYGNNFFHEDIAPVTLLEGMGGILELWHGPTAAFKDMALQLTPRLLAKAMEKAGGGKNLLILVATSGDTGKAALEGFKDVPGISVVCFYPDQGVSKVQALQMQTTDGKNTHVIAVDGNFDDCQNGVKAIFGDEAFNDALAKEGWQLSSANSINWGRLCPQIVYYFYGYFSLVQSGHLQMGQPLNVVVPTGNFGNILAAWYAKEMGLPLGKLICASNENRILTDFFQTGIYDRRRTFYKTTSPSMDILISSNLERFLFMLSGQDGKLIARYMEDLQEKGYFQVGPELLAKMQALVWAGSADEKEGAAEIRRVYARYHYVMDTHTAVGAAVYTRYCEETKDDALAIIDATASPFKFAKSVMEALGDEAAPPELDELLIVKALATYTGQAMHPALAGLEKRPILHQRKATQSQMKEIVEQIKDGKAVNQ